MGDKRDWEAFFERVDQLCRENGGETPAILRAAVIQATDEQAVSPQDSEARP